MSAAAYPLLRLYRERRRLLALLRQEMPWKDRISLRRLARDLESQERRLLADLRASATQYRVSQEQVAKRVRVHRTMVNKVWNGGQPGRQREWVRSERVVTATYRALEAAGWVPPTPELPARAESTRST